MNWFQNFVSLWSETVGWGKTTIRYGCELVSKFCIFVVWNSKSTNNNQIKSLWIGFKILYLCGLKQYQKGEVVYVYVVNWFQNFVSLWSETVFSKTSVAKSGCELVSKFCIFVVWNSTEKNYGALDTVVNWFQNFVSLWSETVCGDFDFICNWLWIGFKILYLCGLKQLENIA